MEFFMGRPNLFKDTTVASIRFETEDYKRVQEIAALESLSGIRKVTTHELIRQAVNFVYADGERLRECFRRSRASRRKRF